MSLREKKLVSPPCPVCGSTKRISLYASTAQEIKLAPLPAFSYDILTNGHYPIVKCNDCGLCYTCPRESDENIKRIYSGGSVNSYLKLAKGKINSFRRKTYSLQKLCGPGGNLLEIGCATGLFLRTAREAGYDVYGCDPWEEAATIAQQEFGTRVKIGGFNPKNYAPHQFRIIVLWSVIEHVTHPIKLIRNVKRILMPQGWLVISTPNINSLSRKILRSHWHFFEQTHLMFFSPQTLSCLLRSLHFSVHHIKTDWRTYPLTHFAHYCAKWSKLTSRILITFLRALPYKEILLSLPSGSMDVYATKNP